MVTNRQASPGLLHGVLGQVHGPVDDVEEGEGEGEEDAGVLVDGAGPGQLGVGRHRRALLEEDGHGVALAGGHGEVPPLQGPPEAIRLGGKEGGGLVIEASTR